MNIGWRPLVFHFLIALLGLKRWKSVLHQEDILYETAGLIVSILRGQFYAESGEKQSLESGNFLRIRRGQFWGRHERRVVRG